MTNPHEELNRRLKAEKIVAVLLREKVPHQAVVTAGREVMLAVAKVAKVNPPSEATWNVVMQMYKEHIRYNTTRAERIKKAKNNLCRVVGEHRFTLEYFGHSKKTRELRPAIDEIIEAIEYLNHCLED